MTKDGAALCTMARSLDQILAEVTSKSDPQRQIVLNQISSLPTQQAADEAGLAAKKDQANEDILSGARRRGLGFSGIPLGEQAKYAATDYAPAVANLKTSYGGRKATLDSALADIGRTDYTTAQDIFGRDRSFEEQQRQFNEQQAAASRAAAQQSSIYSGLYGKGQSGQQQAATDPIQQVGFDEALTRVNSQSPDELISDMISTLKGNAAGVPKDKFKIETYKKYAPQLFTEAEKRFTGAQRAISQPGLNILGQSPFGVATGNLPAGLKFGR